MKNYVYVVLMIIVVASTFLFSCERDDICAETTTTTPLLIVRFYDVDNPTETKNVTTLRITNEDGSSIYTVSDRSSRDSIAIPLRILSDTTTFQWISDSADDDSDMETGNTDTITFSYTTEEIFLSRACGYVTNFTLTDVDGVSVATDTDNWIDPTTGIEIVKTNIQDETEAHVKIYH